MKNFRRGYVMCFVKVCSDDKNRSEAFRCRSYRNLVFVQAVDKLELLQKNVDHINYRDLKSMMYLWCLISHL